VLVGCKNQEDSESSSSKSIAPTQYVGCANDNDCKGDRICEKSVCVSPTVVSQVAKSTSVLGMEPDIKPPKPQSKLQKLLRRDMIGVDVAYFEKVSGLARESDGKNRTYLVDNCEIVVSTSSKKVRNLRIAISPACSFDLNEFFPNYNGKFPPLTKMTYGSFDKLTNNSGSYLADCVVDCGNAADPVIYEHWYSSRADGVIEVMLESIMPSLSGWSEAMQEDHPKEWLWDGNYNCTPNKYQPIVRSEMRDAKVEAITVGYDIQVPKCPGGLR